jgi:hypothetical protein
MPIARKKTPRIVQNSQARWYTHAIKLARAGARPQPVVVVALIAQAGAVAPHTARRTVKIVCMRTKKLVGMSGKEIMG